MGPTRCIYIGVTIITGISSIACCPARSRSRRWKPLIARSASPTWEISACASAGTCTGTRKRSVIDDAREPNVVAAYARSMEVAGNLIGHCLIRTHRRPKSLLLRLVVRAQPPDPDIPEAHLVVMVLQHQRILGGLRLVVGQLAVQRGPIAALVIVHQHSVEETP